MYVKNLMSKKRVILKGALIRCWAPPSGLSPLHLRGRLQHRATLCVYGAVWLFLSKGVTGQKAECGWHSGTQPPCSSHCILQPCVPAQNIITVTMKSTCTVVFSQPATNVCSCIHCPHLNRQPVNIETRLHYGLHTTLHALVCVAPLMAPQTRVGLHWEVHLASLHSVQLNWNIQCVKKKGKGSSPNLVCVFI